MVFEAIFTLMVAVLPVTGIVALIRHQFWSHDDERKYIGKKKYFWFYAIIFAGIAGSTAFLVAARSMALLASVGGDMVWADITTLGSVPTKNVFAVYACSGFVGSVLFAIAARYMHLSAEGKDGGSIFTAFYTWHLLVYVFGFLFFTCELVCISMLSYGTYKSFANPILFWFTFPYPVFFMAFLALCLWNRVHPATSTDSKI